MKQHSEHMRVGDLVMHLTEPEHGVGLVLAVDIDMWGMPQEPSGIKVRWRNPTWHDPDDGASIMYRDEVEVISETRR